MTKEVAAAELERKPNGVYVDTRFIGSAKNNTHVPLASNANKIILSYLNNPCNNLVSQLNKELDDLKVFGSTLAKNAKDQRTGKKYSKDEKIGILKNELLKAVEDGRVKLLDIDRGASRLDNTETHTEKVEADWEGNRLNHDQISHDTNPESGLRGGEAKKLIKNYEIIFQHVSQHTNAATKILTDAITSATVQYVIYCSNVTPNCSNATMMLMLRR